MAGREESQTVQLGLRMKEPLRAELEKAAKRHGLSMNAEIVRRLETSFAQEQRLADVFGSEELFALMRGIAGVMDNIGQRLTREGGERGGWIHDPQAYANSLQIAATMLNTLALQGGEALTKHEHFPQIEEGRQRRLEEERERLFSQLRAIGIEQ
jgi:hypothetical protein